MPNEPPCDTLKINGHLIFIHLQYKTAKRIFWANTFILLLQSYQDMLNLSSMNKKYRFIKKDSIGNKVKQMHAL